MPGAPSPTRLRTLPHSPPGGRNGGGRFARGRRRPSLRGPQPRPGRAGPERRRVSRGPSGGLEDRGGGEGRPRPRPGGWRETVRGAVAKAGAGGQGVGRPLTRVGPGRQDLTRPSPRPEEVVFLLKHVLLCKPRPPPPTPHESNLG